MIEAGWSHGPCWEIQYLQGTSKRHEVSATNSLLLELLAFLKAFWLLGFSQRLEPLLKIHFSQVT